MKCSYRKMGYVLGNIFKKSFDEKVHYASRTWSMQAFLFLAQDSSFVHLQQINR